MLLAIVSACPLSAAEDNPLLRLSNERLEALQTYQTQLDDLESEYGPYHQSLLEPLNSMIALYREQGSLERVAEVQSRQLQVVRTVFGFEHPDVVPVLQSMISNQLLMREWEQVSDQLEHIRHLYASNKNDDPEILLQAIDEQAFWYLSRSYLDEKNRRVRSFFEARTLYRELTDLAEESYPDDSSELIPWLYKQAISKFQLVQFLNASEGVDSAAISRLVLEDGPSRLQYRGASSGGIGSSVIPVIEANSLVGEYYLREGRNLVARIQDILETQNELEAQAMARIYRSDFQLLMGQGIAIRGYREAQEMLLEAGISQQKIDTYFERPVVIPVEKLFGSIDEAIAYQEGNAKQFQNPAEDEIHLGLFTAWSEALGSTAKPFGDNPLLNIEIVSDEVDLSFSVSSRGDVSSVKILDSSTGRRSVERKARKAARDIQFRPAIVDGKGIRVRNARIRYRIQED